VAEYLIDFNAAQAAMRAGYSPKWANNKGWSLLQDPFIADAVRAAIKDRVERLGMDADDVLLRALNLYDIAMAGEPVMRWDKEAKCRVPTGEYVFDGALAAKALEMIGKILGAFRDRSPGEERPFLIQIFTESKDGQ
jgi:phage terminase small subunit